MTVTGLQVLLNVENMETSVGFYEQLGFEVVESYEFDGYLEWVLMTSGGARLMLNRDEDAGSAERRLRPTYHDVVFYCYVPSAFEMHTKLSALGQQVGRVERQHYGLDEFLTRDPDGYCLAIASDVPADQA